MLVNRRGVKFNLMLTGKEALSTAALAMNSTLCQLLLSFLKTIRQICWPIATHINLNLVQTLAHTSRLSSTHLIKRKLLRSTWSSFLLELVIWVDRALLFDALELIEETWALGFSSSICVLPVNCILNVTFHAGVMNEWPFRIILLYKLMRLLATLVMITDCF